MRLTEKEIEICNQFRARDINGMAHCKECPLNISELVNKPGTCYRNIDTKKAICKTLKRYE